MKVEKCNNTVYLTWNNPIEARILIKILTSTFPRNYIDYLLICLIRDKFEIALRNPSRIVGHVYKIMLDPIKRFLKFLKFRLQNEFMSQNERSSLELAITLLENLIQEKNKERGD